MPYPICLKNKFCSETFSFCVNISMKFKLCNLVSLFKWWLLSNSSISPSVFSLQAVVIWHNVTRCLQKDSLNFDQQGQLHLQSSKMQTTHSQTGKELAFQKQHSPRQTKTKLYRIPSESNAPIHGSGTPLPKTTTTGTSSWEPLHLYCPWNGKWYDMSLFTNFLPNVSRFGTRR